MEKKKWIWVMVSCLMVVTLLMTSCGGAATDEEDDVNGGEEEVNGEEEEDTTGKDMVLNSAGKLVERPRYGGWYHLSRTTDVRGFDDCLAACPQYMSTYLSLTHDELYTGDWAKMTQGTGQSSGTISAIYLPQLEVPCLATGYEIPDNETIIWHIRQGVHFHDKPPANGRELDAHDIAFNLNRAFTAPGSYLAGTYREDLGRAPTSIQALDDWTVEMKVPPEQQVPILFACNDFVFMHAPEVIEEYGDASNWEVSLGTGPFMLTDYVQASSLTWERNPDYWRTNPLHPDQQLPYIDGVEFLIIPDATTAQAAFRTGKLEARPGVSKDDWEALMRTNPDLLWDQWQPSASSAVFMRLDKPELPYDDIRVRQALMLAIDHPSIVNDYYEGLAEIIVGPISGLKEYECMYTPLEGYSEDIQKLYGYDPEEAKQLMTNAGYPDGFECTVLASTEGLLPIVKDYWQKNLNVTMNIDIKTSEVVSSITMGGQHEDMYYGTVSYSVLKCNQWRTDSYLNYSKLVNEEFNEWFEEFNLHMLDWDTLCTMMKEMEPKMRAQTYWIDLPAAYSYFLYWPWLKGWHGETCIGYWNTYNQMSYLWVDTELREEMAGIAR